MFWDKVGQGNRGQVDLRQMGVRMKNEDVDQCILTGPGHRLSSWSLGPQSSQGLY